MDINELIDFVKESNRIESIPYVTPEQVTAHSIFLSQPVSIVSLRALVAVLQPDARFRDLPHIPNVRVGNHVAPKSGDFIRTQLEVILEMESPWQQHVAYEMLHPFTDGNGRSGRALWLHRLQDDTWSVRRGFLHSFYYQTLSRSRFDGK